MVSDSRQSDRESVIQSFTASHVLTVQSSTHQQTLEQSKEFVTLVSVSTTTMAESDDAAAVSESQDDFFSRLLEEAVSSPINIILLTVCGILLYKIYRASKEEPPGK